MSVYRQSRTSANACPRCGETLAEAGGLHKVKYCTICGGVFADMVASRRILATLDRGLLAIAFDAAAGKPRRREDGRVLTCPECQFEMQKTRVESAACDIDTCASHGTWFDAGELIDVMRAFERARKQGLVLTHAMPSVPIRLEPATPDEAPPAPPTLIDWIDSWWSTPSS